jgi:FkbM family methyltransferase
MSTRRVLKRARLQWIAEARESAGLGQRPIDRLRLGTFHTWVALSGLPGVPAPRPITARLAPDGHAVVIATGGELAALHHIHIEEEYTPRGHPETILDLGANAGFATLFFRRRFPEARIIAVEADPRTYARLVRNVASLRNVRTVHAAIVGQDGPVTFYPSLESIGSSMIPGPGAGRGVSVPGVSISTLMQRNGLDFVDLLKVDIEGAELEALRVAPLDRVAELIAEIHYDLIDANEAVFRQLLEHFELRFVPLDQPQHALLYAARSGGGEGLSSRPCGVGL